MLHWRDDVEVREEELHGWGPYSARVDRHLLEGGHYSFLAGPTNLLDVLEQAFT